MKRKFIFFLTTLSHAADVGNGPTIELEKDDFMHVMKERVIQFPEESQKLRFMDEELQYEDVLLEQNDTEVPQLKDTFQTTILSRARRSRGGQRVSYRTF